MTEAPMPEEGILIPDQRREKLMRALRRDHVLSVAQLTELLCVSHMTVRRDIAVLEREGRAVSVPGGVRLASGMRREPAFGDKTASERDEKAAIAGAAAGLLSDGMVLYLDAGTTTGALVPAIRERQGMTVVTNDFAIVEQLTDAPHVETIHTGGRLEHSNRSAVGSLAGEILRRINTDIAFISASSWDLRRGVTTPTESKVPVKTAAVESASTAVLMATSSKFGTFGMYDVFPLERFDRIITDARLPHAAADGIRDLGVALDLPSSAEAPREATASEPHGA
ncbi:DeoR/GlpR family DNA-binding transcription regulator [Sinomonas terrae]|uniref:DeoR/GlpR family DNA-binding transcription regulator n=1 Tax=Sinomonas terrae TaxID=2908838 RepID=A0ABS9U5J7_9MICC|nr:DeoR/GlpR family DNA-binding transcription regulator [Sinomonas terrae]MCH6471952.1 DeoR/GlpR family DNA-binding transcription regulator [Sinomonas terrae]